MPLLMPSIQSLIWHDIIILNEIIFYSFFIKINKVCWMPVLIGDICRPYNGCYYSFIYVSERHYHVRESCYILFYFSNSFPN